ncbi:MAG: hypothetical protein G3I09_01475 [Ferrovum sp.]|nr:hypothetical protein [Ferrovum sp.]
MTLLRDEARNSRHSRLGLAGAVHQITNLLGDAVRGVAKNRCVMVKQNGFADARLVKRQGLLAVHRIFGVIHIQHQRRPQNQRVWKIRRKAQNEVELEWNLTWAD